MIPTKKPYEFRLPDNTQRMTVIGRTGTGKSVLGFWALSKADFDSQPWVIVDYKNEELINSVDRIKEIGLNEVPKHGGLYKVHPHPTDEEGIDRWFWKAWERENCGILIDEGTMVPKESAGLRACLTQGRSKHVPIITLSQRPVWLSRYVFTQADFHAVFHLNDVKDEQAIGSFMPRGILSERLPEYHSRFYDVAQDQVVTLTPVPSPDEIAQVIHDRLKPKRKIW